MGSNNSDILSIALTRQSIHVGVLNRLTENFVLKSYFQYDLDEGDILEFRPNGHWESISIEIRKLLFTHSISKVIFGVGLDNGYIDTIPQLDFTGTGNNSAYFESLFEFGAQANASDYTFFNLPKNSFSSWLFAIPKATIRFLNNFCSELNLDKPAILLNPISFENLFSHLKYKNNTLFIANGEDQIDLWYSSPANNAEEWRYAFKRKDLSSLNILEKIVPDFLQYLYRKNLLPVYQIVLLPHGLNLPKFGQLNLQNVSIMSINTDKICLFAPEVESMRNKLLTKAGFYHILGNVIHNI
jgi:hypothetical protein